MNRFAKKYILKYGSRSYIGQLKYSSNKQFSQRWKCLYYEMVIETLIVFV